MPDAFYRLLAFPNGIAMIGLGYSLWATTRTAHADTHPAAARRRQAGVSPRRVPDAARAWRVPAALVALGTIPVVAGSLRLVELSGGRGGACRRTPATPRRRCRSCVHIVSATVFAILGAFQFSAPDPPAPPGLAPTGGARAGGRRAGGGAVGAVAEPVLPEGRAPPGRCCTRSGWSSGSAMVLTIVLGVRRDPPARLRPPPGVDDPQLRDRPRRRHPGVHPGHRRASSSAARP